MESTTQQQENTVKRPKILSVSEPQQPALAKPRVLSQTPKAAQAGGPQSVPDAQPQPSAQPGAADPKSEADWAEQTLTQAETDAEEQRMANDVVQAFAAPTAQQTTKPPGKQQDGPQNPKNEPKSVPGLLYAIKGMFDSVSRKITGK